MTLLESPLISEIDGYIVPDLDTITIWEVLEEPIPEPWQGLPPGIQQALHWSYARACAVPWFEGAFDPGDAEQLLREYVHRVSLFAESTQPIQVWSCDSSWEALEALLTPEFDLAQHVRDVRSAATRKDPAMTPEASGELAWNTVVDYAAKEGHWLSWDAARWAAKIGAGDGELTNMFHPERHFAWLAAQGSAWFRAREAAHLCAESCGRGEAVDVAFAMDAPSMWVKHWANGHKPHPFGLTHGSRILMLSLVWGVVEDVMMPRRSPFVPLRMLLEMGCCPIFLADEGLLLFRPDEDLDEAIPSLLFSTESNDAS